MENQTVCQKHERSIQPVREKTGDGSPTDDSNRCEEAPVGWKGSEKCREESEENHTSEGGNGCRGDPAEVRGEWDEQLSVNSGLISHLDQQDKCRLQRVRVGGQCGDGDSRTIIRRSSPESGKTRERKSIFVSYSPDAGFVERRFVVEMVRQLKENLGEEDIWFDKDEAITDSPCWFSLRMEAAEKCRAVIIVLSDSYFSCPVSAYEIKVLLDRLRADSESVTPFPILYAAVTKPEVLRHFHHLARSPVNLTGAHAKKSAAEKTSVVVGALLGDLERVSSAGGPPPTPSSPPDTEFTGQYRTRKVCQWRADDLQEWLVSLGVREFYRQNLAENMIDGFLLTSLTDRDMARHLAVDSRVVRRKIMQQLLRRLDKEQAQPDSWHLRARAQKARGGTVYLVCDPADARLSQTVKGDLMGKHLQVIHHEKLGHSKEEFLQSSGPCIAISSHVIVILTEAVVISPFVFQEVMFADWLGKKIVTAMFENKWSSLRPSVRAVLGDYPAVDFETKQYSEGLEVLDYHVKLADQVPGVILEQTYLDKMIDGLKPLEMLASINSKSAKRNTGEKDPKVFISYKWETQARAEDIKCALELNGISCQADINMSQGYSNLGCTGKLADSGSNFQHRVHHYIRVAAVVISCITPEYLKSNICMQDVTFADSFNKPVLPVLLRSSPRETAPPPVRRIFGRLNFIDLSNDRTFKQNLPILLDKVKKLVYL